MTEAKLLDIQKWVKTQVSPERFKHIAGVARTSEKLALRYGLSAPRALWAAWLHDCGKELSRAQMKSWLKKNPFRLDPQETALPGLWHPHVGAAIALKKWGIRDPAILEAIRCHTLGRAGMSPLAQLVFVADFVEPGRDFPQVDQARKSATHSLREGVLAKASMTIEFLFRKRMRIHPRLLETWNYFLTQGKNEKH
jgi:predicted HD superfamily hydrolase involved in NAD metabolism